MQSKLKIFATAFLVFSLSLFLFILGSPKVVLGVVQDSQCIANSCGTSEGTKQVPVYKEVCDKGCPTIHFEWKKTEFKNCPNGYFSGNGSNEDKCYRWTHNGWDVKNRPTEIIEYTANVKYDKSNDPNKCHRPSDNTLRELYGMDRKARGDFKQENHEWKSFIDVNCRQELDGYETVACNDAPIIACEEQCPTVCGYEGGLVPDGQGGYKECPATNSCSTHRWCFPTDSEESTTGYIVEAISIDTTPEIGKPWESGKMIDKYCAYEAEGECPIQCGYEGGDEVPDGQGGYKICPATAACIDDTDDEGDVLGGSTTAEVKGTTTVVLASTAGGDRSTVFLIQSLLLLVTGFSLIYVGKEYLNRYEI